MLLERLAARNPEYALLRDTVMDGFPQPRQEVTPPVRPYWGVRELLAVDDGLVVYGAGLITPASLRRQVLSISSLHDSDTLS